MAASPSRPARETGAGLMRHPVPASCVLLLGLWIVVALVGSFTPAQLVTAAGTLQPMPWAAVLQSQLRQYACWAPFTLVAVAASAWAGRLSLALRPGVHLVAAAGCVAGFSLLNAALAHAPGRGVGGEIRLHAPQGITLYLMSVGGYLGVAASLRSQRHTLAARRLQAQLAEARLDALRVQLHPHFLFNTLHAISTLVDAAPADARRMITLLGDLLRLTLERSEGGEIPLREELAWIERYLALQRVRFGERLRVEIATEPEALGARVPVLVLQPLIENALVHGADPETGATSLRIAASVDEGRLRLAVSDAGPGVARTPGEGIGLRNTRERLSLAYGDLHTLRVGRSAMGGTEVVIELPWYDARG